jgi:pyridoxamine 5'-phosphate oxidase
VAAGWEATQALPLPVNRSFEGIQGSAGSGKPLEDFSRGEAVVGVNSLIAAMRKDYTRAVLDEREVDPDPFRQFALWFDQARDVTGHEANAMTVATVTGDGMPMARTVLLKGFDERGLVFYTSYESAKGEELAANPVASLLFYWPELERQVRVAGEVSTVSREESTEYFQGRPRGSQIAAHLGQQSRVVPDRAFLEQEFARLEAAFADREIEPPGYWGGYRVAPEMFEFWQGRPSRLHDRVRYRLEDGEWVIERLGP